MTHSIVADTSGVPDFVETGTLPLLGERSSVMTATGTTTFHCTIHPGWSAPSSSEIGDRAGGT